MENNTILVDSDFFIALYKKEDSNHKKAKEILKKIRSKNIDLKLTIFCYSEITTVLSQKVSHKVALNFMRDVEKTNVEVIFNKSSLFSKAKEIFKKQSSKNVSFVDVLNIAYCKLNNYSQILSFDSDYKKNDLKILNSK